MKKFMLFFHLVSFGVILFLKQLTELTFPLEIWLFAMILAILVIAEDIVRVDKPSQQTVKYGFTLGLLVITFFFVIASSIFEYIYFRNLNYYITFFGFTLAMLGIYLRAIAIRALNENFFEQIGTKKGHKLITVGPYKYIRHPAYLGAILLVIGLPLVLNSYFSLITVMFAIFALLYRIALEEKELAHNLNGYKEYMQKTNKLIPKFY